MTTLRQLDSRIPVASFFPTEEDRKNYEKEEACQTHTQLKRSRPPSNKLSELPELSPLIQSTVVRKQNSNVTISNDLSTLAIGSMSTGELIGSSNNNNIRQMKALNASLQQFDPLQNCDPDIRDLQRPQRVKSIPVFTTFTTASAPVNTGSRLPTPRRPAQFHHISADDICLKTHNTSAVRSNPTPPSSPGSSSNRRVRHHSSIARLVNVPNAESALSGEKAKAQLAEFDPLISPVYENETEKVPCNPDTFDQPDSCFSSLINTASSISGPHSQPAEQHPSDNQKSDTSMKLSEMSNIKLQQRYNNMSRIPLPISSNKSSPQMFDLLSSNNINVQHQQNTQDNHRLNQSKLRKPEVFAPESIKATSSPAYVTTTAASNKDAPLQFPAYQRRISFPAEANDILSEQLTKEREASRRLSANLISAQGLISQPNVNDGLQYLVDVQSPTNEKDFLSTHSQLSDPMSIDSDNFREPPTNAMSSKVAFNKFRHYLSPFEKTEILRYPVIYYVGSHAKKINASLDQTTINHGYDDEKGDYRLVMKDHLHYRYEVLETLGKGSFGQVVKCRDHKLIKTDPANSTVAVKIIRNKKRFQAQALTEVKILEQLMNWDPKGKHYTVRMLDSFYFREHLCIVFECLSLNLYEVLQQNGYHGFSMGLVKRFAYQILMSVKLLSEHNVIHCDLKPENILLKQPDRSAIRVIDFGSSCSVNEKIYTYIQSRFYRAPEVILGLDYGPPIDMWSTGCILAELYTGHPLFPGEDEPDQLACIMQILGIPDRDYLERCTRRKQFFDLYDKPRRIINAKGRKRRPKSLTFVEALKKSSTDVPDKDFLDFIRKCLTWEPNNRMKPVEALSHPWLQSMKK